MHGTRARIGGGDLVGGLVSYMRRDIEPFACWSRRPDLPGPMDIFDTAC